MMKNQRILVLLFMFLLAGNSLVGESPGGDGQPSPRDSAAVADAPKTVLPGYEDTVWGQTAQDGRVIAGLTWEKAAEAAREHARLKGIQVLFDGFPVEFLDQKPILEDGRVLVPIRPVFEHFRIQCRISWDAETSTATIVDQRDRRVVMRPGEYSFSTFSADGGERIYPLDVPATVIGGRIMLPLRLLLESFAYKVAWSDLRQTVDIQDTGPNWRKLMEPGEWRKALEDGCALVARQEGGS